MNAATKWYYEKAGERSGPVDLAALSALITGGGVRRDTLVWSAGMPDWQAAESRAELAGYFRLLPPALPAAAEAPATPPPLPAPVEPTIAALAAAIEVTRAAAPGDTWRRIDASEFSRVAPGLPWPGADTGSPAATPQLARHKLAGPWRRYFARLFDSILLGLIYLAVVFLAESTTTMTAQLPLVGTIAVLMVLATPLATALLNAVLIGLFGNTPGKALYGIRAKPLHQPRLSFDQALAREMAVWFFGTGATIPVVGLVATIVQFSRVVRGQPAGYDRTHNEVISTSTNPIRLTIAALLTTLLLVAFVAVIVVTTIAVRGFEGGYTQRQAARASSSSFSSAPIPATGAATSSSRHTPNSKPDTTDLDHFTSWTNPTTNLTVALPPGWRYRGASASNDSAGYSFENTALHLRIDLIADRTPSTGDIAHWLDAFGKRTAATETIGEWSKLPTNPDIQFAAAIANDGGSVATYYVTQVDSTVWRLVYTDNVDRTIRAISDTNMTIALFNSIGVKP